MRRHFLPALALAGAVWLPTACDATEESAVNDVVGNAGYVEEHGNQPDDDVDDFVIVRSHLAYVERRLRARDVSSWPLDLQVARAKNLDRLHAYWMAGDFPENASDGRREPRFVDDDPTPALASEEPPRLCAVGWLLAQDLGLEAALAIDDDFRFSKIGEIESPVLVAWAEASGLDLEELAAIQPSYRPRPPPVDASGRPTPEAVRRALSTRLADVNRCVHDRLSARDEHPAKIGARVVIGQNGRIAELGLTTGMEDEVVDVSVQRCVAGKLGELAFRPFSGSSVTARHDFSIVGPIDAGGDLNEAYMPVIFQRAETGIRRCARSADPLAERTALLAVARVTSDGEWGPIALTSSEGPATRAYGRCVRSALTRQTLPLFVGEEHRLTHAFSLSL